MRLGFCGNTFVGFNGSAEEELIEGVGEMGREVVVIGEAGAQKLS